MILWHDFIAISLVLSAFYDLCLENNNIFFAYDEKTFFDVYEIINTGKFFLVLSFLVLSF